MEDIERSILYFENDGGVVRLNKYGVIGDYISSGGLEESAGTRIKRYKNSIWKIKRLKTTYPDSKMWIQKIRNTLVENIKTKGNGLFICPISMFPMD